MGPQEPCTGPVLLILSELVANSVRHAAVLSPKVTVIFAGGPDAFALGVTTGIRTVPRSTPRPWPVPGGVWPRWWS